MFSEKTNLALSGTGDTTIYGSQTPKPDAVLVEPAAATPIRPQGHEFLPASDRDLHFEQFKPISQAVFVNAITDAAATIKPVLDDEVPEPLEEEFDSWIDLHGFDADSDPVPQIVARQAIFHILLKATLVEAESRRKEADLPALTPEPRQALQTASDQLDTPVLDRCILNELGWRADDDKLAAVLALRTQLLESPQPDADLARLYAALTPAESRRSLGQYRTPPEPGTLMRRWSTSSDACVLDPGLGAAVLSSPSHPRWLTSAGHDYVVGIDRSPLAALMGATALTLYGQAHEIHVGDFLDLGPEDLSKSIDVTTINPPYTRYDLLPADYREELKAQIANEAGVDIPGTPPLYVFFILHARQLLSAGDKAAFLTPQSFLATEYGTSLRNHLLSDYDITALIQFNPEEGSVFDEAEATGLISLVEVAKDAEPSGPIQCLRVDRDPDTATLLEAVRNGEQGRTDWGFINQVSQEELTPDQNWQVLFDPPDVDASGLTPLSELAEVKRGPMTGKNAFFCLSQDDVDELGVDESYLSPMVPQPQHVQGYDFREVDWERARADGKCVWVLYHVDDIQEFPANGCVANGDGSAIQQYLQFGEDEHGLHESGTTGSRTPWYRIRRREPTSVLVTYWSRGRLRFILNETDARHINNYYGFCNLTLTEPELKAVLAYLNSGVVDEVLRSHQRSYGEGLDKVEPNDLEDVPVLDPRKLRDDLVTELAEAFDDLRETARTDDRSNVVRTRINQLILQEL